MKISQISILLNRDQRTLWLTYNNAVRKIKKPFVEQKKEYYISITQLENRKFSILEVVVNNLIKTGLTISQVAHILKKHRNHIWSAYSRYKKKNVG